MLEKKKTATEKKSKLDCSFTIRYDNLIVFCLRLTATDPIIMQNREIYFDLTDSRYYNFANYFFPNIWDFWLIRGNKQKSEISVKLSESLILFGNG